MGVLDGKVAIVTGVSPGGIGAAYVRALAEAGASVLGADIREDAAAAVAQELRARDLRVASTGVDITSEESARAMAARARDLFGGVDILVNNAAIMAEMPREPLMNYPMDWWDRIMRVNVGGALVCAKAVVPSMRERGGGKIINQSSGGAFTAGGAYGASKLALVSLTASLARELGPSKINVNAIAPGAIESAAGLRIAPPDGAFRQMMRAATAIQESAPPEALCGTLLYLASPASDFMTGQCLSVDGGWIMRL